MGKIRNFVIIAHIDHGKSTLADRFLEFTGTVEQHKMREQFLDMHPLERERGITIKMQPVRMTYRTYILNLIDTPGHVDFSYEVSRALAAVEGAILLVDATQGIQAQTLANLNLAKREHLVIIPVVNKIDLASAEIEKTKEELAQLLGVGEESILMVSGKTGQGVEKLLRVVVEKIPPPEAKFKRLNGLSGETFESMPLRALVFDSSYDSYQGVIAHVRVFGGTLRTGDRLLFMASGASCEALELGVFSPERTAKLELDSGEIGYIATGIKEPDLVKVGDTITIADMRGSSKTRIDADKDIRENPRSNRRKSPYIEPLPGYRDPTPMVFASVFPENQDKYEILRESLKKLKLNDAALSFEPEDSKSMLGRGFRVGFLGTLHIEIVSERLKREYGLKLIFTNPSVAFRITKHTGAQEIIYAASRMPAEHELKMVEEPWVMVEVLTAPEFLGDISTLVNERGGVMLEAGSMGERNLMVKLKAPLREIIIDFHDRLKSISRGFASMAYEVAGYKKADLVRLDILVAGVIIPALAEIVPRRDADRVSRDRVAKLKNLIPKELFPVALQAAVGGRVIARETIPALKKDVTGYLYGGDRTRKMKLWKKQQRGKKKLKAMGEVKISPEVFLAMLKK